MRRRFKASLDLELYKQHRAAAILGTGGTSTTINASMKQLRSITLPINRPGTLKKRRFPIVLISTACARCPFCWWSFITRISA